MPRRPRYRPVGFTAHCMQRGNNRQALFTSDADMVAYAHWLGDGAMRFEVDVHGWVFMTNHVHQLLNPMICTCHEQPMRLIGRKPGESSQ